MNNEDNNLNQNTVTGNGVPATNGDNPVNNQPEQIESLDVFPQSTTPTNPVNEGVVANEPVQPTPSEVPEPVQPTPNVVPEPVQATPSEVPEPVQPTPSEVPEPVQPTPSEVPEPVQPTPNVVPEPVQPAANIDNPTETNGDSYDIQPVTVTSKKKGKKLLKIAGLILLLAVFGFVILFFMNNPRSVFNKTIDCVEKKAKNGIDKYKLNKTLNDVKISFNTDNENLKNLSNYTYGFRGGVDNDKKSLEGKIYLIDQNNNEYSYTGFLKEEKLYSLFSSYDKLIYTGNVDGNNNYDFIFDALESVKNDDLKYLESKVVSSLKKHMDSKNFSKHIKSIKINNKKVMAIKNTYSVNKKEEERLYKAIWEDIYKDDRAVNTVSKITGKDTEALLEEYTNYVSTSTKTTTYNIYTDFLGKVIGYDSFVGKDKDVSFYGNMNNFSYEKNDGDSTAYVDGIKKKNKLLVTIKNDKQKVGTLSFDKFTKDEMLFDFDFSYSDNSKYTGKVNYKNVSKKDESSTVLGIKINDGSHNHEFKLDINRKYDTKVADINENEAVALTDEQMSEVIKNFVSSMRQTPIGGLVSFVFETDDTVDGESY